MRNALPSLTLTGQRQLLNIPTQHAGLEVRLTNESFFTLRWTWGARSGLLLPAEVDVLRPDLTAPPQITIDPQTILPPTTVQQVLLAEVATSPDSFGDGWPQQMARLAQVGAVSGLQAPSLVLPGDNAFHQTIVPVPAGTQAIGYLLTGGGNAVNCAVLGQQTNVLYFSVAPTGVGPFNVYPFSGVDSSVALQGTDNGAACTIQLITFPYPAALWVAGVTDQFVSTVVRDTGFHPVSTDLAPATFNALRVALGTQALFPLLATNIAANGIANIVPAVVGKTVRPEQITLFHDGANAVGRLQLQDTTGTGLLDIFVNATRGLGHSANYDGPPVVLGRGLQIQNLGAAASFVSATISGRQE